MDFSWSVMITTSSWILYSFLETRYQIQMSRYIRLLMMLTLFCDAFFGYILNLYEQSFLFDKILHMFGTYSFSLFAYALVMQLQKNHPVNRSVKFILAMCIGITLGTMYEISEFIGDNISHPNPPNQPSLLDTDVDLIGDLIGAVIAGIHVSIKNLVGEKF
ncbi:hypothetical protein [Anaerosinus sp.]|uniref:hypothetical protein n=1 Tax=Selenobaculum sp. TaxID=3074374 RepID=UPI003AB8B78F